MVRSTSVPTAERLVRTLSRSPSQWPGTSRVLTSRRASRNRSAVGNLAAPIGAARTWTAPLAVQAQAGQEEATQHLRRKLTKVLHWLFETKS